MLQNARRSSHTHDIQSVRRSSPSLYPELLNTVKISLFSLSRWKLEAQLLWKKKILILLCICAQFLHATATNIAYYRHIQGPRLKDTGYDLIPLLTPKLHILSEFLFFFIFSMGVCLAILPFLYRRPRVYMSTMFIRTIVVMALCIFCRCITFLSTSLPGPAPHCQPKSNEYRPPENIYQVIFRIDVFKGCGDLIFSSHSSLSLTLILSMFVYGKLLVPKRLFQSLFYCVILPSEIILLILIIAARKHYTVDIVVAGYTTPLLYYASYYFVSDQNDTDENEKNKDDDKKEENDFLVFPIKNKDDE